MKKRIKAWQIISIGLNLVPLLTCLVVSAQTSFQNLNFEAENLSTYTPPATIPIGNAFPGWVGYIGGTQVQEVWYDAESLGGSAIALIDSLGYELGSSLAPLQGNDSALGKAEERSAKTRDLTCYLLSRSTNSGKAKPIHSSLPGRKFALIAAS